MRRSAVKEVSKDEFQREVLESDLPVVVDFWAPWCAPCLRVAPELEKLARERDGVLKVVKVNVDEAPEIASSYGVMSIPTIALFRGGQLVARVVGARPKAAIEKGLGLDSA